LPSQSCLKNTHFSEFGKRFHAQQLTGFQGVFDTADHLPDLSRHLPGYWSVIEEIVEGFVEGVER
jgi:hypothetical protein